jgi:hypothetical protein
MKQNILLLFILLNSLFALAGGTKGGATKTTSPRVAKEASSQLRSPKSTAQQRSVAGSALSQSPGKSSKSKK